MRFLVINVLNDCCICMWLIVCMYAGISGQNSFKGGRTVKPGKKRIFFLFLFFLLKMSESVNSCRDGTNKTLDLSLDLG